MNAISIDCKNYKLGDSLCLSFFGDFDTISHIFFALFQIQKWKSAKLKMNQHWLKTIANFKRITFSMPLARLRFSRFVWLDFVSSIYYKNQVNGYSTRASWNNKKVIVWHTFRFNFSSTQVV